MAYIGNPLNNAYSSLDKQVITGDGGQNYTLTKPVANAQEIEVFVNNVRQEPGVAYTAVGTALSMTGNVLATDDFYVVYQGKAVASFRHSPEENLTAKNVVNTGVFYENAQTVSENHTVVGTRNAMSAGPVTIQSGVSVTVETGGRWVVV